MRGREFGVELLPRLPCSEILKQRTALISVPGLPCVYITHYCGVQILDNALPLFKDIRGHMREKMWQSRLFLKDIGFLETDFETKESDGKVQSGCSRPASVGTVNSARSINGAGWTSATLGKTRPARPRKKDLPHCCE